MKSRGVSLKPPLKALAKGVRMARVMTMSSGFFWVLRFDQHARIASLGLGAIHC